MAKTMFSKKSAPAEAVPTEVVPTTADSLRLAVLATEMVQGTIEISRMEEELKARKVALYELKMKRLPDLMTELKQDKIGLPGVGEFGADIESKPYYHANISNEWEPERVEAAFDYLDEIGAGDLIKNVVVMQFSRGEHERAKVFVRAVGAFMTAMADMGLELPGDLPEPVVRMSVPWNTLTAFVREQTVAGTILDLDKLGAEVGTQAIVTFRKG